MRDSVLPAAADAIAARLDNRTRGRDRAAARGSRGRSSASPTCRSTSPIRWCAARASLQQTADAKPPRARVHRTLLDQLGVAEGAQVKVRQGRGEAVVAAVVDPAVPPGVVRLAAAHASTCGLDGLSRPGHAWSGRDVDALLGARSQSLLGPAWLPVWTLVKIVAIAVPLILCVAYLTFWRAQGDRLDAGAHRAESRRAVRACCSRSPT